jgi:hypothetical protein
MLLVDVLGLKAREYGYLLDLFADKYGIREVVVIVDDEEHL